MYRVRSRPTPDQPFSARKSSMPCSTLAPGPRVLRRDGRAFRKLTKRAMNLLVCDWDSQPVPSSNMCEGALSFFRDTPIQLRYWETGFSRLVPVTQAAPISMGTPPIVCVWTLPPSRSSPSRTTTSSPRFCRALAAERPASPAPTTTTRRREPP